MGAGLEIHIVRQGVAGDVAVARVLVCADMKGEAAEAVEVKAVDGVRVEVGWWWAGSARAGGRKGIGRTATTTGERRMGVTLSL